jgi:pimeloyl-ACP methyl ester carboxylesterase
VKRFLLALLAAACAHTTSAPRGLHIDDGGLAGQPGNSATGQPLPVLFVHGNGGNLTQWQAQLDHLRRSRRAVAFDLRGMGRSAPAADGDYSVAAMADDVQAVADALHLRRFVIVGHSYGGAVVTMYAAKHPERVAGVVLADAAGNIRIAPESAQKFLDALRKDKDAVVAGWFAPILKPSGEAVRKAVLESEHNTPADVIAGALGDLPKLDITPLVAAYHGPRLAIAAADIESPSSFHKQFPDVPVKKIYSAGHWLMMDKPDEFNAILDEFLAGVR